MATLTQSMSSKANSLLSTGPVTPEGKAKMFANPLRHGLTSRHLIIPGENQSDFEALHASLRSGYRPATQNEDQLISQVAENYWRLLRARRVETATLAIYVDRLMETAEAAGDPDRALALAFERYGRDLDRLRRYETSIERAYLRVRKELDRTLAAHESMEEDCQEPEEESDGPDPVSSVSQKETAPEPVSSTESKPASQTSGFNAYEFLKSHYPDPEFRS